LQLQLFLLVLSIISYQFSTYNAKEILNIASYDIRSNANIQSHDLSTIIEQELDKVSAILKALASAPAIHNNGIERGRDIITSGKKQQAIFRIEMPCNQKVGSVGLQPRRKAGSAGY
jgi:hypothetical protein